MLKKLFVQNYALIEQLEVDLSDRLTIITGETGAGKSILLGALSLILGKRANPNSLYDKKKKCVVEGTFDISKKGLSKFFSEHDLDYEEETIIRREITPAGKSRSFINDTPVTLNVLSQLSQQLVSLHSQHQSLHLMDRSYQLQILDSFSKQLPDVSKFQSSFQEYHHKKNILEAKKLKYNKLQQELDYINFQANELEEAEISDANELVKIEQELSTLHNSEEIRQALSASSQLFNAPNSNIMESLQTLQKSLEKIQNFGDKFSKLNERLTSTILELNDIGSEAENLSEDVEFDPNRNNNLQNRMDLLVKLQNKHSLNSLEDLMRLKTDLCSKRDSVVNKEEDIGKLEVDCAKLKKQLIVKASKISKKREKNIPSLTKKINEQLFDLGMSSAKIVIEMDSNAEEINALGLDKIDFLFSSNKGSEAVEIKKVASGGEISRLMLAIQGLIAGSSDLPTLIFDEIDTGISGEVAIKVGKAMKKLSKDHQLICITHLPQIACIGDRHFRIYKEEDSTRTLSKVEELEGDERIIEIGTILSGEPPSKQAKENAKELLAFMNE